MQPASPLETDHARRALVRDGNCEFVDPQRFRELLTSNLSLRRADDPRARTRGLVDATSGMRFLIEEERLFGEG